MKGKIQASLAVKTVKIGILAVAVMLVSLFLKWFTVSGTDVSVMEAILDNPDSIRGVVILIIAAIWIVVWFILGHPKVTLVGNAVLVLFGCAWGIVYAKLEKFDLGIGFYLYMLAVVVCIVCAFLTKTQKTPKVP